MSYKIKVGSSTSQISVMVTGHTNSKMRKCGKKTKLVLIIKVGRLSWFGHVSQVDGGRLPEEVMHNKVKERKIKKELD